MELRSSERRGRTQPRRGAFCLIRASQTASLTLTADKGKADRVEVDWSSDLDEFEGCRASSFVR